MPRPARSEANGSSPSEASFDARLARLEAIVGDLERGELSIEPAIERYQEGISLLKQCHEILAGFRQRVEELSADAEKSLRPYAKDPDVAEPPRGSGARDSVGEA